MEIAPIAGIRVMPAIKPRPNGPELTASFDIESAARPDEDTYTRSGKKAAGAEEESEDQSEELEDAAVDPRDAPASEIDLFA